MMKHTQIYADAQRTLGRAVVALAIPAAVAAAAVADQTWLGRTRTAVDAHYAPFGLSPNPNVLTWLLVVVALATAIGNYVVAGLACGGHRAAAMVAAGCGLLVTVGFAALCSLAAEYGGPVMAMPWRVLPWLLPVAVVAAGLDLNRRAATR